MTPTCYLPDSNIVSQLIRGDLTLHLGGGAVLRAGGDVYLSSAVEYEVRRGLLWKRAVNLERELDSLRLDLTPALLQESAWVRAAELWSHSRKAGMPLPDGDILIAAHALDLSAILVTNNEKHFRLFEPVGLQIENWTTP